MTSDILGIIGTVGAISLALIAVIKLILVDYFKRMDKFEETKHTLVMKEIDKLKDVLSHFEIELQKQGDSNQSINERLMQAQTKLSLLVDKVDVYTEKTNEKMRVFETVVTQISQDILVLRNKVK
jgi:hypothetical protein